MSDKPKIPKAPQVDENILDTLEQAIAQPNFSELLPNPVDRSDKQAQIIGFTKRVVKAVLHEPPHKQSIGQHHSRVRQVLEGVQKLPIQEIKEYGYQIALARQRLEQMPAHKIQSQKGDTQTRIIKHITHNVDNGHK